MGDTNLVYDESFGINTFKRKICAELGVEFWNRLAEGITLPDMETEGECNCQNMYTFMRRLEQMAEADTVQKILYNVRHGIHPSQSAWARDEFLEIGNLDEFLKKHLKDEWNHFIMLNREKKDFYGQEITDDVLEFIRQNPSMLAPVRKGNKLHCMAFPCNMNEYLKAEDSRIRRYHACHCPFAKESILTNSVVSETLCNCSLGHVMNFTEAFLGRPLGGTVVKSVLKGDLTCEYEITIPEDIMEQYLPGWESETVISNYQHYFKAFADSGIINYQEGTVSWIMPAPGEKGPAMAFGIHLSEEEAEAQLQKIVEGIRAKQIPQMWHITPDAEPENIIEIMKRYGFQDLSENAPEPTMMLKKSGFKPYVNQSSGITCRRVETREDFRKWIDVVNTALHGWEMIDAEHYFAWVENEDIAIYLGELNGIPISTAAAMRHGETASLEFVSTLEAYRRRGAAAAVCSRALEELFADGVSNVTLGACGESVQLYKKFGFRSYFNNVIMYYEL